MVQGISSGGLTYLVISNVLAVLTTIAVTLRLLSRQATRSRNNEPGVRTGIRTDDGICVASLPIYLAMVVQANLWATMGKIGFPTRSLTPDQLESFLEIFFANQITYSVLCPVVKLSVLRLYRRIFWHFEVIRIPIMILEILVVAWGIAVLLVSIFQCSPVQKAWEPYISGHCINNQTFFWGNAISNLLLDVLILALPSYPVWKGGMRWRQKCLVTGIFLLGSFVCVASILRIVELGVINNIDVVLTLASAATWTTVEPGVGIISACLPCYWPWLKRYVRSNSYGGMSSDKQRPARPRPYIAMAHPNSEQSKQDPCQDLEMSNPSNRDSRVTETEIDKNDRGYLREDSKDHLVRPAHKVLSIHNQRSVNGVFVDAPDRTSSGVFPARYTRPGA